MEPAISIKYLYKEYKQNTSKRYMALRDVIADKARGIFAKSSDKEDKFWALSNINLNIQAGERIGIIGNNGAGKSTLLKVISRITPPSKGTIIINGRVASLLEVGTGFHPELTGKENIYLNGSILGLKKIEIDKKIDEIIAFSGVERFIDSPLKHYSSGMQLRLAFSVAAHLDAEILLIDEVLAVGDIDFQKKCLGKMEEITTRGGRTILFVSHNLNYISSFCNKCVLLSHGQMSLFSSVNEVVAEYLTSSMKYSGCIKWDISNAPGNDIVKLNSLRIVDKDRNEKHSFGVDEEIGIEMNYQVLKDGHLLWLGHNVFNQSGINVFDTHSVSSPYYTQKHEKGNYTGVTWIPGSLLNTGTYVISSAIFNHLENIKHFHVRDILTFQVYEVIDKLTAKGSSAGDFPGVIRPFLKWSIEKK